MKKLFLILAFFAVALLLPGCSILNEFREPPSSAEAKEFLTKHRDEIDCVVEYLKELDCDDAWIHGGGGSIFYEFDDHLISSAKVRSSVRKLWLAGCSDISKDDENENNTISFTFFSRTRGSIDCEIACTINGSGAPKTQFQIYREEIGDGWYYVYNDYEEWRCHPKQYEEFQPDYTPSE